MPIFVSSVLFGVAILLPLIWPTGTSMILFSAVSNLGLGAFLSVDTALITQVLPNDATRGKDRSMIQNLGYDMEKFQRVPQNGQKP